MLGSIARHAVAEAARRRAFELLQERDDRAELLAVALNSDFKDMAVAAVDLFPDRADLDQIIGRGRNKSAVKRARGIVREGDEQAARAAAAAAAEAAAAAIDAEPAVLEPLSELASPPHGRPAGRRCHRSGTRRRRGRARSRGSGRRRGEDRGR